MGDGTTAPATTTHTATPANAPSGDSGEGPAFADAIDLRESYAFEITAHYRNLEVSGRHDGDDHYHDIRLAGTRVEEYVVDGTAYVLTQGVCVVDPDASTDPASDLDLSVVDAETYEGAVTGHATVRPTGTTSVDGEPVYVYEVSTDGVESLYYVEVETNLLRRFEMAAPEGDVVVEFHSWGEVAPIEPPDTTCV